MCEEVICSHSRSRPTQQTGQQIDQPFCRNIEDHQIRNKIDQRCSQISLQHQDQNMRRCHNRYQHNVFKLFSPRQKCCRKKNIYDLYKFGRLQRKTSYRNPVLRSVMLLSDHKDKCQKQQTRNGIKPAKNIKIRKLFYNVRNEKSQHTDCRRKDHLPYCTCNIQPFDHYHTCHQKHDHIIEHNP